MNRRKNVVFLIIDSLGNYNKRSVENRIMPFLSTLQKESIYFPNMFSEAPYTEAAVMSLLCGKNTLEDEGYFYRFEKSCNIFEYFKENGYEVFNYIQPHVHPSSILKGNTHFYYNVAYDFNVVWAYRLYLYADLYREKKLSQKDYDKIIALLDDNFNFWTYFLEKYLGEDESFSLIRENLERTYEKAYVEEQYKKVLSQKEQYFGDKQNYIIQLLKKGKEHELFDVGTLEQNVKVCDETKKWLTQNCEGIFKRINSVNKKHNFRFRKINWSGVFFDAVEAVKGRGLEKLKGNFAYFKNGVFDKDLMERLYESDSFKAAPSLYSHINHFEKQLLKRNQDVPFFSCIHVDDIHHPEIFFTYDTDNLDLLQEEFKDVEKALDEYEKGMTGSVSYYLSLAYIDKKIKYLFDVLEKQKLMEDTIIVITGDHGFSFDYINVRNSCVNNHYLENYNVPLYICDYGYKIYIDQRICSSKDILPTLVERLQLKSLDNNVTGESLFGEPKDYIVLQNIMGGCPDIEHRKVTIGILTKEEMLVGESDLESGFKDILLTEYYDLNRDPCQKINAIMKQKEIEKKRIYNILKEEFRKLHQNVAKK